MCVTEPGGQIIAPFNPKAQSGPGACNTCATYTSYMTRYGYWTPGDPLEDGDVGGHPGMWINMEGARLAGLTRKSDCAKVNPGNGAAGLPCSACDPPVMEERLTACPTPQPTPSATPPPGPTPTPQAGCPSLLKVGGMFLSAVSCGQQCIKQGYLGWRINYTATELCREGDPGCVCDPARNRCEMPRPCQNPLGADIRMTLEGKFTNDICDASSENPFNCHSKAKADETGVTLFTSMPKGETDYYSERTVTNCVDIQKSGARQLPRNDPRCVAALRAAGR